MMWDEIIDIFRVFFYMVFIPIALYFLWIKVNKLCDEFYIHQHSVGKYDLDIMKLMHFYAIVEEDGVKKTGEGPEAIEMLFRNILSRLEVTEGRLNLLENTNG